MGQVSSVSKRALERMDAFLSETDDKGRMPSYGKVAVLAIVGNEDGAHNVTASALQSLNDTGWTIPAVSACYWVGEAMQSKRISRIWTEVPDTIDQDRRHGRGQCRAPRCAAKGSPLSRP